MTQHILEISINN